MHCRQCHQYVARPHKKDTFTCGYCGSTQRPYLFNFKEILGLVAILIIVPLLCFIAWQLALFKDKVADNVNHQINTHLAQGISGISSIQSGLQGHSSTPDNHGNINNPNVANPASGANADSNSNSNENTNDNHDSQFKLQQSLSILGTILQYLNAGDN
jgi:hypothetical protein